MLQRILTAVLVLLLTSCAWFMAEKPPGDIIKPTPVGGYDLLGTRIYYPREIREQGVEGSITIKAYISVEGDVLETRIPESLHPDLDKIAENAVKRTKFNPATRDGQPLKVWIAIPFVFALERWEKQDSPFDSFQMKVYPDQSYQSFDVKMIGKLRAGLEYPMRFELLLPYNAEKAWIQREEGVYHPERVMDENGEWLIFQVEDANFDLSFNYEPIAGTATKNFQYKFMLNHALPAWQLSIVYDSENVQFKLPPDDETEETDGLRRYSYDLKFQEAYEARFLEVALLE